MGSHGFYVHVYNMIMMMFVVRWVVVVVAGWLALDNDGRAAADGRAGCSCHVSRFSSIIYTKRCLSFFDVPQISNNQALKQSQTTMPL